MTSPRPNCSETATTRREFTRNTLALAAAPLIASDEAKAQVNPTADALFEAIRARYARFLTPDQLAKVKRGVLRNQQIGELLRQVKLANSDEPAFAFRADLP